MTMVRLQKVLAQAGLGSRRTMETWIEQGRVKVNRQVATLGMRVSARDQLMVDNRALDNPLARAVDTQVLLYHKPVGLLCSWASDDNHRTIFSQLPRLAHRRRWIMVGRLDLNTSGLLLLTNNGNLANQLMHPRYGLIREYACRILGTVTPEILATLKQGVMLEDGLAKFDSIEYRGGEGANQWYHVTLSEGRNREVRRIWQSQELQVSRLIRVRYGPIILPKDLPRGRSRMATAEQLRQLCQRGD